MMLKAILPRLIWGLLTLLICRQQALAKEGQFDLVSLECERQLTVSVPGVVHIRCEMVNKGTSSQSVYLLADRLALEGPSGESSPYVYVPSGWERFENVLRYDKNSVKNLNPPSPFHPTVHLAAEQLKKLVLLKGRERTNIDIMWKLPGGLVYPNKGEWILQVKIVYLTQERASRLLQNDNLPEGCRVGLNKAILSAKPKGNIVLEALRRKDEVLWKYDGCRDVVSEEFQHLYSNSVVLRVNSRK